ncbi:MAG: AAA family ATPase [Candidatus Methanomethylophilaceae archaeon]|nr:AAA family ATPase [Candidatus Methanomethylophilaceae archaeon]
MKLLIVAGMPGAGKEELLNVARSMGYGFVRMGDVVRKYYALSSSESRGISVGEFASEERKLFGADVWAARSVEEVGGDLFLIDGCRSMDEVRSFRRVLGSTEIVAVHAPRSERFSRLVSRNREDAPKNEEEFDARDQRELDWGIGSVIALSEHMIINDSDLETFRSRVSELLEKMG